MIVTTLNHFAAPTSMAVLRTTSRAWQVGQIQSAAGDFELRFPATSRWPARRVAVLLDRARRSMAG